MNLELVAGLIRSVSGEENIKVNEPMSLHTSFKVGGPADILVTPRDVESIEQIVGICKSQGTPFCVIGNGTNLVVRDKGIRGVVIKLFDSFNECTVDGEIIKAQAGALLSVVSKLALYNGLSGLEFAEGIPGTLGGAIAMNAGAYNGEMKDVVVKTKYIEPDTGAMKVLHGEEHRFGKRTSFIQQQGGIVVQSYMKLKKGDSEEIKAAMDEFSRRRREMQPLEYPSAGSVFKRPEGYYAGKLIQDCGLRGFRIGGAEVSIKHCGFIVNVGNATAEDVLNVIRHIQDTVKNRFGVALETEVRIIGEE